jgi:hypothetical protein
MIPESGKVGIIEPMNITFQRAIDRFVGVPVCASLSLVDRLRGKSGALSSPRKILVILLSEMGGLVLARPMFERLKQQYPEASIHALLFAKNREVLDLLGVIPEENVLTLDDRSIGVFATGVVRVLRVLRIIRFDMVIDCELFARVSSAFSYFPAPRSAWVPSPHPGGSLPRVLHQPRRIVQPVSAHIATVPDHGRFNRIGYRSARQTPVNRPVTSSRWCSRRRTSTGRCPAHADFFDGPAPGLVCERRASPIRAWLLDNYRRFCDEI